MQNDQIVIYAQSFLEAVQQLQAELPEISDTRTSTTTSSISAPGARTTGAGIAGTGTGTSARTTEDAAKATQKSTKPVTQSKKFQDIGLISPVTSYQLVGTFMPGVYINKKHPQGHFGADMSAPKGTPVLCVADGIIRTVGHETKDPNNKGGNTIISDHIIDGKKISAYYAHLGDILVSPNQKVKQGQKIAGVGASGNANGVFHLHFQLSVDGTTVDPFTYIKRTASSEESQITKLASILENHYDI